jgi:hypothetical protein
MASSRQRVANSYQFVRGLWAAAGLGLGLSGAGLPRPVAAQQPSAKLVGHAIDRRSHAPIRNAQAALLGTRRTASSDEQGRFAHDSLLAGSYVVQVRAVGYAAATGVVELAPGEVLSRVFELEPLPVQLDPVTVERTPSFAERRRRAFELRRAAGRGYFVTQAQIERANARSLGDVLRDAPGVVVLCRGAGRCAIHMARTPAQCRPDFVVDGFPASLSTSLDMPVVGITGIEIYRTLSETPLEFLKADNVCGTVVIWTRSER